LRILVDYRPALRARTGVGEYMHELVRAYAAAHADEVAVFTSSWRDRPAASVGTELRVRVVDCRVPVRVLNYLWHRLEWPPVERLAGTYDVVHAAHPLLIPARRAAQVITVHDLFFLDSPERTHAEIRRDYPALAASHARRADAIVTPSVYTATRVAERFGIPRERIYTCPPGAPRWRALGRSPNVPENGYLLFVGTLEPRKNVGILLEAYGRLAAAPHLPRLVLAGGAAPGANDWLRRIEAPPLRGRVEHVGYVRHDDRERLYSGARALVMPSLDEGFGLPALEAMSAGIPVIVSNRGSLPEVVGDAGTLVAPDDLQGWTAAIERAARDQAWARERGAAALARAATFTWTATAARLRQAYVDAAGRRSARP
jgi:glycosyltransferase involved in cell wall biosynthesis